MIACRSMDRFTFHGDYLTRKSAPRAILLLFSAVATATLVSACHLPWQKSGPPPGTIVFGTGIRRVSPHEINIVNLRNTFHRKQSIAWVAYLAHPAGARTLRLTIFSASGKAIRHFPIPHVNPKWTQIANSGERVQGLMLIGLRDPGTYTLELTHRSKVLADGSFRLRP